MASVQMTPQGIIAGGAVGSLLFVKLSNAGQAVVPTAVGEVVIGVNYLEDVVANEETTIQAISGSQIVKVKASAAISQGDPIGTAVGGKGVKATSGQYAVGYALDAASGADVVFRVQVAPHEVA